MSDEIGVCAQGGLTPSDGEGSRGGAPRGASSKALAWLAAHGDALRGAARARAAAKASRRGEDNAFLKWRDALGKGDLQAAEAARADGRYDEAIFGRNMFYTDFVPKDRFGIGHGYAEPCKIRAMATLAGMGKMDWVAHYASRGALRHSEPWAPGYVFAKACAMAEPGLGGQLAREAALAMLAGGHAELFAPLEWIRGKGGFDAFDLAEGRGCARAMADLDAVGAMAIHGDAEMVSKLLGMGWAGVAESGLGRRRQLAVAMRDSIGKASTIAARLGSEGALGEGAAACQAVLDRFMARVLPWASGAAAQAIARQGGAGFDPAGWAGQEAKPARAEEAGEPEPQAALAEQLRRLAEEVALLREGQVAIAQALAEQRRPEKTAGIKAWLGRVAEHGKGGRHGA